ncbi:MAG: glycerol-3-phosphate acyltransferase [Chloroflexia bacterium]|nr:glycerol-3-phosphate acyltransferase [Chloroflexia bacterium]
MAATIGFGSYLLGSIPFSLLIAWLWGRKDLRQIGSGNPGGMNTLRELGWGPGGLAILLDAAKGWVPVLAAKNWTSTDWLPPAAAAAAVSGHCYSLFLILDYVRTRTGGRAPWQPWWKAQPHLGGKGLASAIGVLLALSLPTLLSALVLFGLVILLHCRGGGIGSAAVARASTAAILSSPALLWLWHQEGALVLAALLIAIVTTIKHVPYLALNPTWPNARAEAET